MVELTASKARRYLAVRVRRRHGELVADGSTVKHVAIVINREGDGLTLIRRHRAKAGTVEHAQQALLALARSHILALSPT